MLQCESSSYYVGIAPTQKVRERIEAQFSGVGSDYCKEKKPTRILCIWPAKCEAIEAAVFYGMQQVLNAQDKRTLGGWTQTSARPSPLVVMQMEQSRRQLANRCFACNGPHHAKYDKCPGSNQNCMYKCILCDMWNNISSRGQSDVRAGPSMNAFPSM